MRVRTTVKEVFGAKSSAPEVIVNLFQQGTIDPCMRWLLSILRLWFRVLGQRPEKDDLDEVIESARGRLGKGAVVAFRWGVSITTTGLQVGDRLISAREEWFVARKVLTKHLKGEQARHLSERRPNLFGGLVGWNEKQHCRFLATLSPFDAQILMKLWSGALMCKHKRSQLYGESSECACGCLDQAVKHLILPLPCMLNT